MNEQKPILIITGAAPDVMADIAAIPLSVHINDCDFMAIGLDAVDKYAWPIQYVATYHHNEIPEIRKRREEFGGNTNYLVIAHQQQGGVNIVEPFKPPSGSSALLGALVGIRLGYQRIILCGCPLMGKNAAGASYEAFREGWRAAKDKVKDRVRSMSGWTMEFLGAPTEEWIRT